MSKIKLEAFLPARLSPGGVNLMRLLKEIEQEYGDKVEIDVNIGHPATCDQNNISALPALVVGELIRFIGVCPDKESLVASLKEAGLD